MSDDVIGGPPMRLCARHEWCHRAGMRCPKCVEDEARGPRVSDDERNHCEAVARDELRAELECDYRREALELAALLVEDDVVDFLWNDHPMSLNSESCNVDGTRKAMAAAIRALAKEEG